MCVCMDCLTSNWFGGDAAVVPKQVLSHTELSKGISVRHRLSTGEPMPATQKHRK